MNIRTHNSYTFVPICGFVPLCKLCSVNSRTPGSRYRRSSRSSSSRVQDNLSREERKEATRRAIIAAALKLLDEDSFSALSLREVTREAGIVPAAFYRHFESMDALGLVLMMGSLALSLREIQLSVNALNLLLAAVDEGADVGTLAGMEHEDAHA